MTFRVVGRSAGDATGTWRIDNLDLLGVVSPIAAPSAPGLIITSPTLRSFGFAVTSITLQGTATNVTGSMAWTNAGTHDSGAIAAANGWTLADLGLAVGLNPISVSASNAAGQSTSATLVVSREAAPSPAGTNVIVFQGFEPGDSWAIASGLAFASTSPGAADTPANQRVLSGGASWQVEGSVATLELAQASIAGYTGRVASLRLSATSGAPGAGLDAADQFRVFVALDGAPFPGFPDQPTLEVVAGAESAWGYDATNVYVADAGLRFFTAPAPDGLSSAACASLLVNLPDSATSIALRIHAACDPGEHWNVDDIAVRGGSVTDADGDGLPDAWELQYFASLTNAGAGTDADADGMSDVVEYLSGTVPTNPNSLLKAEAVSVTSGNAGFVIRWQSASNRVYTLDRADEPAGVYAGLASNLAATPPANLYTDAIPTNVTHVYRVRTQAP